MNTTGSQLGEHFFFEEATPLEEFHLLTSGVQGPRDKRGCKTSFHRNSTSSGVRLSAVAIFNQSFLYILIALRKFSSYFNKRKKREKTTKR